MLTPPLAYLYLFFDLRYLETSTSPHTAPRLSPKTPTWPTSSTSWPSGTSSRSVNTGKAHALSPKLGKRHSVTSKLFIPPQMHQVKGAFNALGGADRLASNRKCLTQTCAYHSWSVRFMEGGEATTPLTFTVQDWEVLLLLPPPPPPPAALASHDYILKIVPTVYEDLSGKQKFSYQYTVANKVLLSSRRDPRSGASGLFLRSQPPVPTYGPSAHCCVDLHTHLEVKAGPCWLEKPPQMSTNHKLDS